MNAWLCCLGQNKQSVHRFGKKTFVDEDIEYLKDIDDNNNVLEGRYQDT